MNGTDNKYLSMETAIAHDGKIYAVDIDTWFFVCFDLSADEIRVIADVQPEEVEGLCFVSAICYFDNRFYLIQRNSYALIAVDETGNVYRYGDESGRGVNSAYYHTGAMIYKAKLYILPGTVDGDIRIFDLFQNEFIHQFPLSSILDAEGKQLKGSRIYKYLTDDKNGIFGFVPDGTNLLVFVNVEDMISETIRNELAGTHCFLVPNHRRILIAESKRRMVWEYLTEEKAFRCVAEDSDGEEYTYEAVAYMGIGLLAMDENKDVLSFFNQEGKPVERIALPSSSMLLYDVRRYNGRFVETIRCSNKEVFLPFSTNGFVTVEDDTLETEFHPAVIPEKQCRSKQIQKKHIIQETEGAGSEDLVTYLRLRG